MHVHGRNVLYTGNAGEKGTAQKPITGLWTIIRNTSVSESKSQKVMSTPNAFMSAGASDSWNITRWCWTDKIEAAEDVYDNLRMSMKATSLKE